MKQIILMLLFVGFGSASFAQDLTVNAFMNKTHTAATTYNEDFTFPTDNSMYDEIIMNIALTCPAGGCDPWDRFASIRVVEFGQSYEIGRYITPYGNNWCSWTLDVSDYRELLKGEVELESWIETWSNGWDLTVSFDFYLGTPDYEYVDVKNLWVDYDFTYGDSIFFSNDLPLKNVTIPSNAEKTVLRVVNTGHGQGNTDNAAEFSQKTHEIVVNGNTEFNQFLWNSSCNSNPCSPQGGTWQLARAGWCPGAQVDPTDYDLTSLVTPGLLTSLDYKLEPFFNQCSPWNPACSDGATCAECTYNNNGHTKPNYKMSIQLITYSSTPIQTADVAENEFHGLVKLYPNPANGEGTQVFIQADNAKNVSLDVVTLSGQLVTHKTLGAIQGSHYEPINMEELTNGVYFVKVMIDGYLTTKQLVINQ